MTVTLFNEAVEGALAVQISAVPGWALARFTSLHVTPAPDKVSVCPRFYLGRQTPRKPLNVRWQPRHETVGSSLASNHARRS